MKVVFSDILLALFIFLTSNSSFSQQVNEGNYYHRGMGNLGTSLNIGTNILSTGNTGTGDNINVTYHRCNWKANPDDATKTLIGNVTTYFTTITSNVSHITLDFNNNSFNNDSLKVLYHGTICNFVFGTITNNDIIDISLPTTIANTGTLDSFTIKYQGIPPAENGDALGYQRSIDILGNNYIYTLSESYEDKDWWPCKADMQDKIDSIDINVTVPNTFWVAANGIMTDSATTGSSRTFKFKHRYPIASYLVAIGIAKYKKYYLGSLAAGSKNVPFVVNLFPGKTSPVETNILNILNNHKLVFDAFNTLYGEYPYSKEKHGFYEFGFSGGMEHQTFSGIGGSSLQSNSILAHELGHQWWGDKVSFATWNNLWLAEGFATYSEVLMAEFVPTIGVSYTNKLLNNKSTARLNNNTPIYISDIANSNIVWTPENTTAVYNRGCMVASMLRCLLGDTKFFTACKNYLADTAIAYKSATTEDLQRNMQSQFGENMAPFFNEWIYKKGTPNYTVLWGNESKKINIKLNQTVYSTGTTSVAATFFPMPVVLNISNGTIDTTIVIYHKASNQLIYSGNGVGSLVNSNTISFNLSFIPTTVTFDPENKTMANGSVSYSAILPITKINIAAKTINNNNIIKCSVVTDNKIVKIVLQKSTDGIMFNDVETTIASTIQGNEYQFIDTYKNEGKIFYRTKVFFENEIQYSNTIAIDKNNDNMSVLISPNPAQNIVNVNFSNPTNASIRASILSADGKTLVSKTTNTSHLQFNLSAFLNGQYFIEIYKDNIILSVQKLVVNK